VLLAALALGLTATACDGVGNKAFQPNIAYPFAIFPITNAPTNVPTALNFLNGPTFANTNFAFDVAFDIDPAGVTRVYPVRALAGDLAGGLVKRVGLQLVPGSFESLREAPRAGYDTITAQVVVPGSVLAVELLEIQACQFSLGGSFLYGKLVVDSIRPDGRRIFGRAVAGPNCGFRELMPDSIPER
jgi:hypothetical protein